MTTYFVHRMMDSSSLAYYDRKSDFFHDRAPARDGDKDTVKQEIPRRPYLYFWLLRSHAHGMDAQAGSLHYFHVTARQRTNFETRKKAKSLDASCGALVSRLDEFFTAVQSMMVGGTFGTSITRTHRSTSVSNRSITLATDTWYKSKKKHFSVNKNTTHIGGRR